MTVLARGTTILQYKNIYSYFFKINRKKIIFYYLFLHFVSNDPPSFKPPWTLSFWLLHFMLVCIKITSHLDVTRDCAAHRSVILQLLTWSYHSRDWSSISMGVSTTVYIRKSRHVPWLAGIKRVSLYVYNSEKCSGCWGCCLWILWVTVHHAQKYGKIPPVGYTDLTSRKPTLGKSAELVVANWNIF